MISIFLSFSKFYVSVSCSIIAGQRGDFQVVPFERRNEMTSSLGTHQRWQLAESLVPHTWSAWEDVNETVPRAAMQTKVRWCEGVQTGPGSEWWGMAWCEAGESSFNSMHSNGWHFHTLEPWVMGWHVMGPAAESWIVYSFQTPAQWLHLCSLHFSYETWDMPMENLSAWGEDPP